MATGVLVLGIERGTKLLAHLIAEDKRYTATIRLGAATTTDDAEGDIIATSDTSSITDEQIHAALTHFRGEIMQKPSSVSAIKVNGKRAHELVRQGQEVDLPARPVTIFALDVHGIRREQGFVEIDLSVHCSSGTYIRSIARDLGQVLAIGGHLTALHRNAVSNFTEADAYTLEELENQPQLSLSIDQALATHWPVLAVNDDEYQALSMGKWLAPRGLKGIHAAQGPDGRVVALVKEQGKRLATVFVARPSTL